MKNNNDLLKALNLLLIDKLSAINQLMSHSEMCENLGYSNLHTAIQKLAMDQMLHAEWLIERISFLDGSTILARLNSVMVGRTVSELMSKRKNPDTFRAQKDAIKLAQEVDDQTTANLLKKILALEEIQTDWLVIQGEQKEKKGPGKFLISQAENLVN